MSYHENRRHFYALHRGVSFHSLKMMWDRVKHWDSLRDKQVSRLLDKMDAVELQQRAYDEKRNQKVETETKSPFFTVYHELDPNPVVKPGLKRRTPKPFIIQYDHDKKKKKKRKGIISLKKVPPLARFCADGYDFSTFPFDEDSYQDFIKVLLEKPKETIWSIEEEESETPKRIPIEIQQEVPTSVAQQVTPAAVTQQETSTRKTQQAEPPVDRFWSDISPLRSYKVIHQTEFWNEMNTLHAMIKNPNLKDSPVPVETPTQQEVPAVENTQESQTLKEWEDDLRLNIWKDVPVAYWEKLPCLEELKTRSSHKTPQKIESVNSTHDQLETYTTEVSSVQNEKRTVRQHLPSKKPLEFLTVEAYVAATMKDILSHVVDAVEKVIVEETLEKVISNVQKELSGVFIEKCLEKVIFPMVDTELRIIVEEIMKETLDKVEKVVDVTLDQDLPEEVPQDMYAEFLVSIGLLPTTDPVSFDEGDKYIHYVTEAFRKMINSSDKLYSLSDFVIGSRTTVEDLVNTVSKEIPYVDVKSKAQLLYEVVRIVYSHILSPSFASATEPPKIEKPIEMLEFIMNHLNKISTELRKKKVEDVLESIGESEEFRFIICQFFLDCTLIEVSGETFRASVIIKAVWNYLLRKEMKAAEKRKLEEKDTYASTTKAVLSETIDLIEEDLEVVPNTAAIFRSGVSYCKYHDPYREAFLLKGIVSKVIPTIVFDAKNADELMQVLCSPSHYTGIIFTSVRAVDAVEKCMKRHESYREIIESWCTKRNYAAYEKTSTAAENVFGTKFIGKKASSLDHLVELMRKEYGHASYLFDPFFYPHSNLENIKFVKALEKYEFKVHSLDVYDTLPNPNMSVEWKSLTNKLKGYPEYLVFFSPSCIRYSMQYLHLHAVTKNKGIKVIPMGKTTAEEMKKYGLEPLYVPKDPSIYTFRHMLDVTFDQLPNIEGNNYRDLKGRKYFFDFFYDTLSTPEDSDEDEGNISERVQKLRLEVKEWTEQHREEQKLKQKTLVQIYADKDTKDEDEARDKVVTKIIEEKLKEMDEQTVFNLRLADHMYQADLLAKGEKRKSMSEEQRRFQEKLVQAQQMMEVDKLTKLGLQEIMGEDEQETDNVKDQNRKESGT